MKKKFLGLMAIVVVASVAALNVDLGAQEEVFSSVTLENVDALAGGENNSGGGSYICASGGTGSTSCSTSSSLGNAMSSGCSVSCSSGYYACCNSYENKCQCRSN